MVEMNNNVKIRIMKKTIILIAVVALLTACLKNQDPDFPDFDYTSASFSLQSPMRSLILGKYTMSDNSLDNKHQFNIGISVGGLRENKELRKAKFVIDETIVPGNLFFNGLPTGVSDTLRVLPSKYYTTEPASGGEVTILPGSMDGKILVTLKPEFFEDPNAVRYRYIIPVKITGISNIDSLLTGKPSPIATSPNIFKSSDWIVTPKNYTLFGIKYVNEYHGNYIYYGVNHLLDATGNKISSTRYSNFYLERNPIWLLTNVSRYSVQTPGVANDLNSQMKLTIKPDNTIEISSVKGTKVIDATASKGKFVPDGGEWGGQKRDVMYLDYFYTEGGKRQQVQDTLLFRDKAIVFEQFQTKLK